MALTAKMTSLVVCYSVFMTVLFGRLEEGEKGGGGGGCNVPGPGTGVREA